jgi:phosphoribosyl-ATP pyrophosphohydrolase/phosphoribosyl-AMP cyclohydrolase
MTKLDIKKLNFEKMNGLIPVIIQDENTDTVLMLGFMNRDALNQTLKTKKVVFFSRTRQKIWRKGETSGNSLKVISISTDCDNDTLLIKVEPKGNTCHKGDYSCFRNTVAKNQSLQFIQNLYELIVRRKKEMPKNSYTTTLFKSGLDRILQKVGEEAMELVIAGKNKSKQRIIEECSDFIYHLFVLLAEKNISLRDIEKELISRRIVKK